MLIICIWHRRLVLGSLCYELIILATSNSSEMVNDTLNLIALSLGVKSCMFGLAVNIGRIGLDSSPDYR